MKRLILGDVHGWWDSIKQIYDVEQPDEVVILGDYFDSFTVQPIDQQVCYDNLIALRQQHLDNHKGKFIMLLGNHDMHYVKAFNEMYSGFNQSTAPIASYRIERDIDKGILSVIYIDEKNKTIFSHAGVTNKWLNTWCNGSLLLVNNVSFDALKFTYRDGGNSFGTSSWNSPIWVRPEGLWKDPYRDTDGETWMQIVGHTRSNKPEWYGKKIVTMDCLPFYYMVQELDGGMLTNTEIKGFKKYTKNHIQ